MSRHPLHFLLFALALFGGSVAQAVEIVEFIWTGKGGDPYASNSANWAAYPAAGPALEGSEMLIFPSGRPSTVRFGNGDAYGLNVTGHYHIQGMESTFSLGSGGLTFSSSYPTHLAFENYIAVDVVADQTWNIGANARVEFYNDALITGSGKITKTGAGTLDMQYYNASSWTGGVDFNEGTIVLRPGNLYDETTHSSSLGIGTVTIGPDTAARPHFEVLDWSYNTNGPVSLTNNLVLNGIFASRNETELQLLGDITLNADTTFRTAGDTTYVGGSISESGGARKLTVNSAGAIVLSGSSGWTGGTDVQKGLLIFGGEGNTPGTPGGIKVAADAYAGIGVDNNVGLFLGEFDKANTFGTIGFDSDPEVSIDTFTTAIDLTGFNPSVRLGSATSAILGPTATITPQGTDYRFGGGGGVLTVASQLTGARNLVLDSPADLPLTVRLLNTTNDFTGTVTASNSGLIFGDDNTSVPGTANSTFTLPAGTFTMNSGAYIGTEDPDVSAATFLGKFSTTTPGIIGFDLVPGGASPREISGLSMAAFTAGAYVGTASAVRDMYGDITGPGLRLTGTITANSDNVHRFAAYKGGALEVAGTLTGNAMIIGHPDSLGAFGDRTRDEYSTVLVSGNNGTGLAGGTTLYGGRLMLGHNQALGAGALTVAPVTFTLEEEDGPETPSPMLSTYVADLDIGNAIQLSAPELNVGGDNSFTLSGVISGSGELYVGEESDPGFVLTLSGNNTFQGGVYVSDGATVVATSNTALGSGLLSFGGSSEGEAYFAAAATTPLVHGLQSDNYSYLGVEANAAVLTVNQDSNTRFSGQIYSDSEGQNLRLVKTGIGTLQLDGPVGDDAGFYGYGFNGTALGAETPVNIIVQQGTLALTPNFYVEDSSSTVWVQNGGTLALENYFRDSDGYQIAFANPIAIDNGGRIAGSGNISSNISIGTGAILSPGLAEFGNIGYLAFEHLELDAGGVLEWHIQNPGDSGGGRDMVQVGIDEEVLTLVINATSADKFTLKIISLDLAGVEGGVLSGVDREHGLYAWTLFNYDTLDTTLTEDAFDPNAFALDVSQFSTGDGTGMGAGSFSVFQSGNQIMLGFTPVPEPSTYALLALGLGFIGLTAWRKRRAS
jgi:autotransporter-associated beta strand protein